MIKWTTIAVMLVCFILTNFIFYNFASSVGWKILVVMVGFIGLIVVWIYGQFLTSRITCPHCGKPVLTRTQALDQNLVFEKPYELCYFGKEKLE